MGGSSILWAQGPGGCSSHTEVLSTNDQCIPADMVISTLIACMSG